MPSIKRKRRARSTASRPLIIFSNLQKSKSSTYFAARLKVKKVYHLACPLPSDSISFMLLYPQAFLSCSYHMFPLYLCLCSLAVLFPARYFVTTWIMTQYLLDHRFDFALYMILCSTYHYLLRARLQSHLLRYSVLHRHFRFSGS